MAAYHLFFYKVSATNTIGEGELSAYITAKIVPPATPVNVRIESISHNSLRISWDPVPGAWLYSIYRGTINGRESNVAAASDAYYIDNGLDPFQRYYYRVSSNNDIGAGPLSTGDISAYTQPIPLEDGKVLTKTSIAPSYSSYYDYYCFQADAGKKYYIHGSSVFSIGISAYWNSSPSMDGLFISLFQNHNLQEIKEIEVPKSGYIIIKVGTGNTAHTYTIQFYKEQA